MLAEEHIATRAEHYDSVSRVSPLITEEMVRKFLKADLIYQDFPEADRVYFTPQGLEEEAENKFRTVLTGIRGRLLIIYGCTSDRRRLREWICRAKNAGASPFSRALVPPEAAPFSWKPA